MAFDNNPVFFVDPLGLAAEGGGEGEPVKEGGEEKIYNQGSTEEVQIIANKNPKTAQLKENVLMSKGKYADSKYDSYRMSRNAYLRSLSLKQNNPNYDGNDHLSNYKKYGWIDYDPASSSRSDWGSYDMPHQNDFPFGKSVYVFLFGEESWDIETEKDREFKTKHLKTEHDEDEYESEGSSQEYLDPLGTQPPITGGKSYWNPFNNSYDISINQKSRNGVFIFGPY